MKYPTPRDVHQNAAALIIAAAMKSGLLDDVAQALCFAKQNGSNSVCHCIACEILETLAEDFDAHSAAASLVIESYWGEGTGIGPFPEEELAKFRGVETSTTEATS
jgi:hypothetical protein